MTSLWFNPYIYVVPTPVEYPPTGMTGPSSGGYTASASTQLGTTQFAPYMAFDKRNIANDNTTDWATSGQVYNTGTVPSTYSAGAFSTTVSGTAYAGEYLQLQLPTGITLTSYTWETGRGIGIDEYPQSPSSWVLAGSNDGTKWTFVDSRTGVTNWSASVLSQTYTVTPTVGAFTYYRFIIRAIQGSTQAFGRYASCGEWRLFGY